MHLVEHIIQLIMTHVQYCTKFPLYRFIFKLRGPNIVSKKYIRFMECLLSFILESLVFQNYNKNVKIKYTTIVLLILCTYVDVGPHIDWGGSELGAEEKGVRFMRQQESVGDWVLRRYTICTVHQIWLVSLH